MTDEELRKLKRGDLLELLVAQSRETEELREKLQTAEQELASRRIRLNEAGSIANAALDLNGVFAAAQAAADQYLESIRLQSQDTESHCAQLVAEAQEKADRLLAEGGVYIVSGIIDEREQDVQTALSACGFAVAERYEEKGWICLVCRCA